MADKLGNYKWVLIFSTFGNGLFHTCLLFVPHYRAEVLLTGHALLQWEPSTNQAFLLPESPEHCSAFNSFASLYTSITLERLDECMYFLNGNETETGHYSMNEEDSNLYDFIDAISGTHDETSSNKTDISKYISSQGLDKGLMLNFEDSGTNNCSVRVSSPYLSKDWSNSNGIKCKTDKSYFVGKRESIGDAATTFWIYFIIRIIATICTSSCFSLLDATVLAVVKRSGTAEYGKERIWSIFGLALTSPIAGILVDRISKLKKYTDYSPAFYLSNALLLCNIISYFLIKLKVEKPGKDVLR